MTFHTTVIPVPFPKKSVSGGNLGGRIVETEKQPGIDGLPYDVDPDQTIYSGMTKRLARSDGEFICMGKTRDEE